MPDPLCVACDVPRKAVAWEPLTPWYQIADYKCFACKSVLRLVERRQRAPKDFKARRLRPGRNPIA
jgi:hypothetical protein